MFRFRIEEIFFGSFAAYLKPDDAGGGPTDDNQDEDKDKQTEDKVEKEGKFEVDWKTGKDGKKYFTGPDGTKYYDQNALAEVVSSRLTDDRAKRKSDADKQALVDKEEYKKLYEAADTELKTVRVKAELADKLIETNNKAIDTRIKDWPSEIKDMDPGSENIDARITWIEKAQKAVDKINKTGPIDGENGKQGDGNKKVNDLLGKFKDSSKYSIPAQKK